MVMWKVILSWVALAGVMYGVYRLITNPTGKYRILIDNGITVSSSLILLMLFPQHKFMYAILVLELIVGGMDYYIYGRKKVQ